jgi:hypothetical protein
MKEKNQAISKQSKMKKNCVAKPLNFMKRIINPRRFALRSDVHEVGFING